MTLDKPALRRALLSAEPWLAATEVGPQAVDAGSCDRCEDAPRLLPLCGPAGAQAVCRGCAEQLGDDGWCDGHRDEGREARTWASGLPDHWADAVVLWWVATGEVGLDQLAATDRSRLAPSVRELLPDR
ncbi:MAG: hypothetical protein ACLFRD_05840 [Nitriliruptoraceae bacterium]